MKNLVYSKNIIIGKISFKLWIKSKKLKLPNYENLNLDIMNQK